MTDKNTLNLAREWAGHVQYGKALDDVQAAADLISSLPDQWVDGEELREVVADHHIDMSEELVEALGALLPTPPAPRTMDEIEWDAEHQGLEAVYQAGTRWEAVVRMLCPMEHNGRDGIVCVEKSGRVFVPYPRDLTPLPGTRINLTPTGRKYRLEPEGGEETSGDAEKEHGEAPCCLDSDGDAWAKVGGQWHMVDPDFAYDELPEKYGPYRALQQEPLN